ncbi:MAG: hypothetical protein LBD03_08120 [Methanobrevibacter sp.]|nr:hypothetical protein [Candidatus Methanovirga procula]
MVSNEMRNLGDEVSVVSSKARNLGNKVSAILRFKNFNKNIWCNKVW